MEMPTDRQRLDWIYAVVQNPDLTREQAIGMLQSAICGASDPDAGVDAAIRYCPIGNDPAPVDNFA